MKRGVVHLHTHTELSLFDGCGKQAAFIKRAKELGCAAIGLTEHGSMRGITRQRTTCSEEGLKPIYGIEFYLCEDLERRGLSPEDQKRVSEGLPRAERGEAIYQEEVRQGIRDRNHLTVLAKTDEGLRNLYRLSSIAWIRGHYKKPRIDWTTLEQHREGLVVLSGCLSGPVAKPILDGDYAEAIEKAELLSSWFGDDFYLEVMPHRLEKQVRVNKALVRMSRSMGIPLVATQDAHWVGEDDRAAQDALLCIHTRDVMSNPDRFRFEADDFFLASRPQMERLFATFHGYMTPHDIGGALDRTLEIAEKCEAKIVADRFKALLPEVPVPAEFEDEDAFLRHLCADGWDAMQVERRAAREAARRRISEREMRRVYVRRLASELKAISERRFTRYFLIIWDLCLHARKTGIGMGAGRGSGAGSLVVFLLGITDVDPIERELMFERFMAPGRLDLPDIDLDFESRRRDEVLAYLRETYGDDKTAQITTIGTLAGKACLRDLGRVLEIPIREIDEVAATIEARKKGDERVNATIEDAFAEVDACKAFDKRHPQVLQLARKLEGQAKTLGVHAGGVVVSPVSLTDVVPLESRTVSKAKNSPPIVVTAVDMHGVADLGLLKIDVLGVRTIDSVTDALAAIRERHGRVVDFRSPDFDYDDPRVLARFTAGDFGGIFQFDTAAAARLCAGVTFRAFEDVTTLVALDRPGTAQSGLAAEWIKRRQDPTAGGSGHPVIEEICADSLGVIVYQEHVLKVAQAVAGYAPEDADKFRKLISKSHGAEALGKEADKFIAGAVARGFERKFVEKLFAQIAKFGGYAFNKSHAAVYAATSYRQMWLKTYYPVEFWWAMLSHEPDRGIVARYAKLARRSGIEVRPPDVNAATDRWTIHGDAIVGSLMDLKGVGVAAVGAITAARPFRSFVDFAKRVERRKVNRKVVEILLRAGAMADLVPNQREALASLPDWWDLATRDKLPELARRIVATAAMPDWTEDEAAAEAAKVNPLAQDRSVEAQEDFLRTLGVEFANTGDEDFWNLGAAYLIGVVGEVKVGRHGGDAQYAYVALSGRGDDPDARLRFDGEAFEAHAAALRPGQLVAVHVDVSAKWRSIRGHYAVDVLELRRKIEAGEDLTSFEAALTTDQHPVSGHSRRDVEEVARAGGGRVVGLVTHLHRKEDRKNREMAFFGLQGIRGYLECVCFSRTWAEIGGVVRPGRVIRAHIDADSRSCVVQSADLLG
jgi:DNA polymerase-3 subunit alpha